MNIFRNARLNLRRQGQADTADLEQQQTREAQEMREPQARSSPISSVLRRVGLAGRAPQPTSSPYDGSAGETVSPKTPQFQEDVDSNSPPSRLSQPPSYDDASRQDPLAMPAAAARRMRSSSAGSTTSGGSGRRQRRRFDGADPAEMRLADMAADGRRRRHRRSLLQDQQQQQQPKKFLFCFPYVQSHQMRAQICRCSVSGLLLLLLLVMYLSLMLTHNIHNNEFSVLLLLVSLAVIVLFCHSLVRIIIMVVHPPTPEEDERFRQRRARAAGSTAMSGPGYGAFPPGTDLFTPGGYAVPRQPIRVVLARDEEAAGVESVAAKTQPPAYGLWRETVRVDPNRIYWQRNNEAPPRTAGGESNGSSRSRRSSRSSRSIRSSRSVGSNDGNGSSHGEQVNSSRTRSTRSTSSTEVEASLEHRRGGSGDGVVRPPSYASEDGVSYVVEAQPRSIAPTTDVPTLTHPAEEGRVGQPAQW